MSSTGRNKKDGEKTERNKEDYYITPKWCIEDFLKDFTIDNPNFKPNFIVDPCAGGDDSNEMAYPQVLKSYYPIARIVTYDIRQDSKAVFKVDYLKDKMQFAPDLIISNPPFLLAEQFIRKGMNDLTGHGVMIFLLRINFFGAQKRQAFFKDFLPHYCYITPKRPSFCKKATDSTEYAHFVWLKGESRPKFCQTKVIQSTVYE